MENNSDARAASGSTDWKLLSNHGVVLFYLSMFPNSTRRDMARNLSLTERTIFAITADLENAGMVLTTKVGRNKMHTVLREAHLKHPLFAHVQVGQFVDAVGKLLRPSLQP